jgi:hypothetical protein
VVLMQRGGRRVDPVARKQRARGAGVLARNEVGGAQHLERARACVGQITDRRGDDEQDSGHWE